MKTKYGSLSWIPSPSPGHWRARLTLPDGSRPVVHFDSGLSEERARDMARALSEKAERGDMKFKGGPAGKTVGDLIDPWLELVEKSGVSTSTVAKDTANAKRIRAVFGHLPPAEVTTGPLRAWVRALKGEGLGASQVVSIYGSLGKLFDTALGEEWITLPANPCRHPGMRGMLPTVEAPEEIVTLTAAQVTHLLNTERGTRYLVAVTSGLRDGELAGLQWGDIKEVEGILVYDVQRNYTKHGELGPLKTKAAKRLVPVHSSLVDWHKAHSHVDRRLAFFSDDNRGWHYRPHSAALIREDLDLPDASPVTFHALRRTFSTMLDSAGVPENLRDKLMGHAARSIGGRHYTKVELRRLRAAVETILIATISAEVTVLGTARYAEPNVNTTTGATIGEMCQGGVNDDPQPTSAAPKGLVHSSKSAMAGSRGDMAATLTRAISVAAEAGEWALVERLTALLEGLK